MENIFDDYLVPLLFNSLIHIDLINNENGYSFRFKNGFVWLIVCFPFRYKEKVNGSHGV
jgi:hypothetical protein